MGWDHGWAPIGAHCLINNVTGELTVGSVAAIPNRIGVADGRTDQHGCAARDHGGGGRPLSIGMKRFVYSYAAAGAVRI